jgi:predicted P-loop ATPase
MATHAAPILPKWGQKLTATDYLNLANRWITCGLVDFAGLRRVDSPTGREMFSRKRGDLAGIVIPNVAPWDAGHIREYRERLDNPELEYRSDGTVHEANKYLQPPGRPNLIYFPPGVSMAMLEDRSALVLITEGEFKALALWRLANHECVSPRFLPIAVAGVWNWRGTIGKVTGPNGDRRDVKGVIPDLERIAWKGRRVIVAFDADSEHNAQVRAARWQLTSALVERGASVGFLEWPIEEGKGIDDRLVRIAPDRVLADIVAVEFGDWRTRILRNEEGRIIPCYENVALYLENSTEWNGVLGYNEFTAGYFVLKPPPAPVTANAGSEIEDHFDTELVRWLERRKLMVKPDLVRRVVDLIARRNSYHPVRDYLETLPAWDGVPRISTWLIDYCGVESSNSNPNGYAMAVGEKFLISAVKRIMHPGAKCDSMLVLEGRQGIGKSTVPRILAGDEWFSDQLADMGSKDASLQLRGLWIVELSELDVLNRAELARAKAFLTQQIERFRLPYGRRVVQVPRQCVFVGTTNSDSWLKDETGGRRFWPVRCQRIDVEALRRDRNQLWAEVLHHFRSGATWWLDDAQIVQDAVEEQRKRYQADIWQEQIASWLESPRARIDGQGYPVADLGSDTESVTLDDILHHCIGKPLGMWTQSDKNRIAGCLTALGWERRKLGPRTAREWRYRRVSQ